jgi:hypothetical protein
MSKKTDPQQVRQLQEDAAVKLGQEPAPHVEGFDPYSTATSVSAPAKPRRTLDDMRKLSEEIKRNRARK